MHNEIKQSIRRQFNRAAATYDQYCSVQQTICEYALQWLLGYRTHFSRIVDIGCGTGESTARLIQHLTFDQCYALDFSEELLSMAKSKLLGHLNITWVQSDFDQRIPVEKPFDLIFSNMALQWSDDLPATLGLWKEYLGQQGLLLFTIPIDGNFPELKPCYKKNFLSHSSILDMLSMNDWHVLAQANNTIQVAFENSQAALRSLKATGTNRHSTVNPGNQGLSRIRPETFFMDPRHSQLSYKIGTYLIRKCV